MKTFGWLLGVALLTVAGCVGLVKLSAPSEAYAAYQTYASSTVRGGQMAGKAALARFGLSSNVGDISDIQYELESEETDSSGAVRIVAVQYLTRVYGGEYGVPAGRPEILKVRHRALVEPVGDGWKDAELEGDPLR